MRLRSGQEERFPGLQQFMPIMHRIGMCMSWRLCKGGLIGLTSTHSLRGQQERAGSNALSGTRL